MMSKLNYLLAMLIVSVLHTGAFRAFGVRQLFAPFKQGGMGLLKPLHTRKCSAINAATESNPFTDIKEKFAPEILFRELFAPPYLDIQSLGWKLAYEGVLVNIGFLLTLLLLGPNSHVDIIFDKPGMTLALLVALPLVCGSLLLDTLPFRPFDKISRETRFMALRLFGRSSDPWYA
jgi:hypothetical protein